MENKETIMKNVNTEELTAMLRMVEPSAMSEMLQNLAAIASMQRNPATADVELDKEVKRIFNDKTFQRHALALAATIHTDPANAAMALLSGIIGGLSMQQKALANAN